MKFLDRFRVFYLAIVSNTRRVTGRDRSILLLEKNFSTTKIFRLCWPRSSFPRAVACPLFSYDYFVHTLETGGRALFPSGVDAERRADSERFRRIETRAKSNSVVLPSKLEPFNRRQSVRDRAPPLLFQIEYMPFYVAAHLGLSTENLHQLYRVAFWAVCVDLTSCLGAKINGQSLNALFFPLRAWIFAAIAQKGRGTELFWCNLYIPECLLIQRTSWWYCRQTPHSPRQNNGSLPIVETSSVKF